MRSEHERVVGSIFTSTPVITYLPAYMICVTGQRMIKFVLMVNRQGQTRLSRYYHPVELSRRAQLEADVVRCCLGRTKDQVTSHPPSASIKLLFSKNNVSTLLSKCRQNFED